jgi:hypothetical protein
MNEFLYSEVDFSLGVNDWASGFILRNPMRSASLVELYDFRDVLESLRSSGSDPKWVFFSNISGKFGGGSRQLREGIPVDPKSNTVHRAAIQFLADQGVLDVLSSITGRSPNTDQVLVNAVAYFCSEQQSVNRAVFSNANVQFIVFISLATQTTFDVKGSLVKFSEGEASVLPRDNLPTFVEGNGVLLAFGFPEMGQSSLRRFQSVGEINANIVLTSVDLNERQSTNRASQSVGMFQTLVACPDCRRPLNVSSLSRAPAQGKQEHTDIDLLVTVACDEDEVGGAIATGRRVSSKFPNRMIVITQENLLSEEVRFAWPQQVVVRALRRWPKRRGLQDYNVPEGYVSPVLFPKGDVMKDTFYSIVQALGVKSLWGKKVWLIDPNGDHGVEVKPTEAMHKQMLAELREWTHPCHKFRESPIALVEEWVRVYETAFIVP